MKVRYTGSFGCTSGKIIVCDPRATAVSQEYHRFRCREDFFREYALPSGTYAVHTNLYKERCDDGRYICYMSHMAAVPEGYRGGELLPAAEDVINTGFSRTVCVVDRSCYDKPGYGVYGILSDALYNVHDILSNGADFSCSDMEPLEGIENEYLSGAEIAGLCGGMPELANNGIRSTHWCEDTVYRAETAADTGVIIWGGAACTMGGTLSVISTYNCGNNNIIICSMLDMDESSEAAEYEKKLRDEFIDSLRTFYTGI